MPLYDVRLGWTGYTDFTVEAENEGAAIIQARKLRLEDQHRQEILESLDPHRECDTATLSLENDESCFAPIGENDKVFSTKAFIRLLKLGNGETIRAGRLPDNGTTDNGLISDFYRYVAEEDSIAQRSTGQELSLQQFQRVWDDAAWYIPIDSFELLAIYFTTTATALNVLEACGFSESASQGILSELCSGSLPLPEYFPDDPADLIYGGMIAGSLLQEEARKIDAALTNCPETAGTALNLLREAGLDLTERTRAVAKTLTSGKIPTPKNFPCSDACVEYGKAIAKQILTERTNREKV